MNSAFPRDRGVERAGFTVVQSVAGAGEVGDDGNRPAVVDIII